MIKINKNQILNLEENTGSFNNALFSLNNFFVKKTGSANIYEGFFEIKNNLNLNKTNISGLNLFLQKDNLNSPIINIGGLNSVNNYKNGINFIVSSTFFQDDCKVSINSFNSGCGIDFSSGANILIGDRYLENKNTIFNSDKEFSIKRNSYEQLNVNSGYVNIKDNFKINNLQISKIDTIIYSGLSNNQIDEFSILDYPNNEYRLIFYNDKFSQHRDIKTYLFNNKIYLIQNNSSGNAEINKILINTSFINNYVRIYADYTSGNFSNLNVVGNVKRYIKENLDFSTNFIQSSSNSSSLSSRSSESSESSKSSSNSSSSRSSSSSKSSSSSSSSSKSSRSSSSSSKSSRSSSSSL